MPVLQKNQAYHQRVPKIVGHRSPSPHSHHGITGVFCGGKKRLSSLQPPSPPGGCISSVHAQTIVTLNASITTPDTLIIPDLVTSEMIPETSLMSLVDSGSSDLFINLGFMEKHHLAVYTIPAIRLCLIDGTCNSIITQAIKLHICFSSSKKQTVNFYITPLDSSCTLMLRHRWLTCYNPSSDWVKGSIDFHMKATSVLPPTPILTLAPSPNTKPIKLKLSPADQLKPGKLEFSSPVKSSYFTPKWLNSAHSVNLSLIKRISQCAQSAQYIGWADGWPRYYLGPFQKA